VVGLGGVFVKARDQQVTGDFYRALGVPLGQSGYLSWAWSPPGPARKAPRGPPGLTVFSLFADDSTYFGATGQRAMVNLRVEGLDALVARLAAAGVAVLPERQDEPYGRFAWILDPDGNRIELWEPTLVPAPDAVPMR